MAHDTRRRTTKTNDNSKISEVNRENEPCRGLATPIIFLYMDIMVYRTGARVCLGLVWSPQNIRYDFEIFLGYVIRAD